MVCAFGMQSCCCWMLEIMVLASRLNCIPIVMGLYGSRTSIQWYLPLKLSTKNVELPTCSKRLCNHHITSILQRSPGMKITWCSFKGQKTLEESRKEKIVQEEEVVGLCATIHLHSQEARAFAEISQLFTFCDKDNCDCLKVPKYLFETWKFC